MTYSEAISAQANIEAEVSSAETLVKAFPTGYMGLTPDAVKMLPEWQAARASFTSAFRKLQDFNKRFVKAYAKEIRAERRVRYG